MNLQDIAGTLEMALQIHPETQRVVVIVGVGVVDNQFERAALQAFGSKPEYLDAGHAQGASPLHLLRR